MLLLHAPPGLPEEAIEKLAKGEVATGLPEREELAQQFTRQLALERTVSQDLFDQAKDAFGVQGLVDIVFPCRVLRDRMLLAEPRLLFQLPSNKPRKRSRAIVERISFKAFQ